MKRSRSSTTLLAIDDHQLAPKGMRVEIGDERFRLLPPFSGTRAGVPSGGDGLRCPVEWRGSGFPTLAGRRWRLRITFKRGNQHAEPRLFAIDV